MPVDFIIFGLIFIVDLFWKDDKNKGIYCWSIFIFMLGYFVNSFRIFNVDINIIFALGSFAMLFSERICKRDFIKILSLSLFVTTMYIVLNLAKFDVSSVFNCSYVIAITLLFGLMADNHIMYYIMTYFLIDIFNYIYLIKELDNMAIFSREFVFCIAVSLVFKLSIKMLNSIFINLKNNKAKQN